MNISCINEEQIYVDLTHLVEDGMPVFPGDRPLRLRSLATVNKNKYANSLLSTGMHVGTHMGAPAHMVTEGKRLKDYPVDAFMGLVDIVDATQNDGIIDVDVLENLPDDQGDFLIIKTNHSQFWGTESYYHNYPVISEKLAKEIVALDYKLVGLDTPSPDVAPYNIHQIFFSENILIIENLNYLDRLPMDKEIHLMALPLYIDADSAPVRVVAEIL